MSDSPQHPTRFIFEPMPERCPHCHHENDESSWFVCPTPVKVVMLAGEKGIGYKDVLLCPFCLGTTEYLVWWQSYNNEFLEPLNDTI